VDGERVDDDGVAHLGSHVAEALDQYQVDDCLVVSKPRVDRNVNIVGVHWNLRSHRTVKRRNNLCRLYLIAHLGEGLKHTADFESERLVDVVRLRLREISVCEVSFHVRFCW
jgi:hypothetical protein